MNNKKIFEYFKIFMKGIFMGIADAIPGVSGGTIALLLGIYEELINTISNIKISLFKILTKDGLSVFWKKGNLGFLFPLLIGIIASLIVFVNIAQYFLDSFPLLVWSFFTGLIIATSYVIFKKIENFKLKEFILVIIASISIILFSKISNNEGLSSTDFSIIYIFVCGLLASSAMILPGISGSLVLVILGVYEYMIESLINYNFYIISTFVIGAIIGLLLLSKILNKLFLRHKDSTFSIMLGLVIGSVVNIWPWKKYSINQASTEILILSFFLAFSAILLIVLIEKVNKK
jgi:putative membrane protein